MRPPSPTTIIAVLATTIITTAPLVTAGPTFSDLSICDYYTKALFNENTAENQAMMLTILVNTAFIGNYTLPNVGVSVPGILAPGDVDGEPVNLHPYFDGSLPTTNTGRGRGESVSFLDGGGVEPLKRNLPATDQTSRQYFLLTHLFTFFASLLQCSKQGGPTSLLPLYDGNPSMHAAHRFMGLRGPDIIYFARQFALAGASFGFARSDTDALANTIVGLFGVRCGAPFTLVPAAGPQLQSICRDEKSCPPPPPGAHGDAARCDLYESDDDMLGASPSPLPPGSGVLRGSAASKGVDWAVVVAAVAALFFL